MSEVTPRDREWMAEALALARRGHIGTAPNPRVGCVLVQDGYILSSGWHAAVGGPHAAAFGGLRSGYFDLPADAAR